MMKGRLKVGPAGNQFSVTLSAVRLQKLKNLGIYLMLKSSARYGVFVAAAAISVALSACSGASTAAVPVSETASPTPSAKDRTTEFVEAVRDRVPMINSSSDAEIAKLGKDICVDPKDLGMTASAADELHKSMLVIGDHAKNDAEASVIVGLAKQHLCRPS